MKIETKLTAKDKKILRVFIPLLVILICIFCVMLPSYNRANALSSENEFLKQEIDEKNDVISQKPLYETQIKTSKSNLKDLQKDYYAMLSNQQLDNQFTSLFKKYNLDIYDFAVSETQDNARTHYYLEESETVNSTVYSSMVVIQAEGSKENITELIDYIYSDCPAVFVEEYQIKEQRNGLNDLSIVCRVFMVDKEA